METPRIPQASSLVITCGNIINWECLKMKKITQSTTEELKDCIKTVLEEKVKKTNWDEEKSKSSLEFSIPCCNATLSDEDTREDLKITVKAMMCNTDPEVIVDAINRVMKELDTDTIDVLLLSVSEKPNVIETFHMDHLKALWSVLERMVGNGQIKTLGVCDLEHSKLRELYDWAKVKPSIDQVNEVSCCIIPPELNAFSKEKKIQLLSHNDAPDILPAKDFQELMRGSFSESDAEGWHTSWVLRYTALIRCRGVITRKGYTVMAQRNLHHI